LVAAVATDHLAAVFDFNSSSYNPRLSRNCRERRRETVTE
jgi:hypothetical protein